MNNTDIHKIIKEELKDLFDFIENIQKDPSLKDEVSIIWKIIKKDDDMILHLGLKSFTPIRIETKLYKDKSNKENVINMCNTFRKLLFRRALLGRY